MPAALASRPMRSAKAIDRDGLNAPDLVKRDGRATTHTFRDTSRR
jgi:hypothetical protein